MKVSKLKNILCFLVFLCILFLGKIAYAEETVDLTYAYTIEKIDLTGINIQLSNKDTTAIGKIISSSVSSYEEPKISSNTTGTTVTIIPGKITIKVNTDKVDATSYYLPIVSSEKYIVKTPTNSQYTKDKTKYFFYNNATTPVKSPVSVARWQSGNVYYLTRYDLEIINTTETDFIPYANGKYIDASNWNVSLDNNRFILKSAFYNSDISKFALKNKVQLVFGKQLEILEPQTTDTDTTIDLRTDRKIRVTNADGSVSHDYTLHVEMPWKVNVPSVGRNFNSVTLKYKNIDGILQESKEESNGGGLDYIYIPAGETVTGSLKANDGENKIIKTLSLTTESGSSVPVKVMPNSNIFTFVMPADVVIFPSKIEFEDADTTSYSLTGEVSQIGKTNMGSIAFSDSEGNSIQNAQAGQTVTATARHFYTGLLQLMNLMQVCLNTF